MLADAVARTSGPGAKVDVWLTCEPGDSSDSALLAGLGRSLGIGAVDFDTLCRTPKASFAWYQNLIAAQRARAR